MSFIDNFRTKNILIVFNEINCWIYFLYLWFLFRWILINLSHKHILSSISNNANKDGSWNDLIGTDLADRWWVFNVEDFSWLDYFFHILRFSVDWEIPQQAFIASCRYKLISLCSSYKFKSSNSTTMSFKFKENLISN